MAIGNTVMGAYTRGCYGHIYSGDIQQRRVESIAAAHTRGCYDHLRGEGSPHWLGGISREPYSWEFNEELRERIRQRENHKCFICWLSGNGKALQVHHIDYDKKNNDLSNLCALCPSCHGATNFNRDYWQKTLTDLMRKRGIILSNLVQETGSAYSMESLF